MTYEERRLSVIEQLSLNKQQTLISSTFIWNEQQDN